MRKTIFALGMVLGISFAVPANAIQCVPYARGISGIELSGDAWRWWSAAQGVYDRGKSPQVGAILVFKKTNKMSRGHLAVVRRVINKREVRIDHANWPSADSRRGGISLDTSVIDVSPNNDWTQVRVWYEPSRAYGSRINPTFGFIYGKSGQRRIYEASAKPNGEVVVSGFAAPTVSVSALQSPNVSVSTLQAPPTQRAAPVVARSAVSLNAQVLARLRSDSTAITITTPPSSDQSVKRTKTTKKSKHASAN